MGRTGHLTERSWALLLAFAACITVPLSVTLMHGVVAGGVARWTFALSLGGGLVLRAARRGVGR